MTSMTSDPLQTLFNVKEPNLSLRKNMHTRLLELGITDPQVAANLIGNAASPIETSLYLAPLRTPPENPRELLTALRNSYAARKAEKPAAFPPRALAYYEDAFLKHDMNRAPFTAPGGAAVTAFDIEYALIADIREYGCAHTLKQMPRTSPSLAGGRSR